MTRHRGLIGELVRLGWPVLVAQVAVMLYGVLDTIMAGRYGTLDLAAVGIGSSIYISVFMATVGVLLALLPVAAQLHGAGRREAIGEQVRQTMWLGMAMMVIAVVLLHFPEPFFWITQAAPEVETKARGYLRAIAWGIPALMLFRVFSAFSNAISKPRVVMVLNLIGLSIKVPLSWALLYGRLGLPEMGAVGCAVATSVATWITCVIAWWLVYREPTYAPFKVFSSWSPPEWRSIRHLLALGLPIGATFFVDVTAFTFMTLFIARLGTTISGAHQIAANLAALLFMMPLSLGNAVGVVVGQSIGARNMARARAAGLLGTALATGIALVCLIALLVFRVQIAALYSVDPNVQAVAASLLAIVAMYHLFDAIQAVVSNALRGYKRTVIPMLISTVALWGLGLGGGYLIGLTPHWDLRTVGLATPLGAPGFWIAAVASLVLASALLVWYFLAVSRAAAHSTGALARRAPVA
ncbi:MAG: MATE family efflux transporter [Burkholderiales bacterium]